jgi:uncharacterized membrane protein YtjA (UPF0391 family)
MRPPIVALIARYYPHSGLSHGTASTAGLIVFVVVVVLMFAIRWFTRKQRP